MSTSTTAAKLLHHDCTVWRASSQTASTLYEKGTKLWTRQDLTDIEEQLAGCKNRRVFTVRAIDGTTLEMANPMFGIDSPIWKPCVRFQEYWSLVKEKPEGPEQTYLCSYLPSWSNTTARSFRGVMADPDALFEKKRLAWNESRSCALLRMQLEQIPAMKRVEKIICFGLGDICRRPAEWVRRHLAKHDDAEARFVRNAMIQHAIALTLAQICNSSSSSSSSAGGRKVKLLAQDPDYTDEAKEMLTKHGFTIVGDYGAGGFAEVDNDSMVVSLFVEAPLKQIVADIARPLMMVSTGFGVFNDSEKPFADADSPRTVAMWKEYEDKIDFPVSDEDDEIKTMLQDVHLYVRRDI
ncbi:hypothetical protein MY10362_003224 [Beauveria mimosiformis]